MNKRLTSFSEHLDDQYGKPGTAERAGFEEEFEAFKLETNAQKLAALKIAAGDPLFLSDISEINADFK